MRARARLQDRILLVPRPFQPARVNSGCKARGTARRNSSIDPSTVTPPLLGQLQRPLSAWPLRPVSFHRFVAVIENNRCSTSFYTSRRSRISRWKSRCAMTSRPTPEGWACCDERCDREERLLFQQTSHDAALRYRSLHPVIENAIQSGWA